MSIFISYSRRDDEFVRRLHGGLAARGRTTWVDWEGIPPTADWMNQIHAAIDAAEAVVFVISPDSIASAVCAKEVEYANTHHKRLIPVVCRPVEPASVPATLARLNWIFFTGAPFEASLETLLTAVDTDLVWVEAHSRLLVRSNEWERRGHEGSLTLRGADLAAAEEWLTKGPNKDPKPTELQTRYVIDSRREATRRRYQLLGAVTIALVLVSALGALFMFQRRETARQQASAAARRLATVAERLRTTPLEYSGETSKLALSTQIAAEALTRVQAFGLRSLDADIAMRHALSLMPERVGHLEPTSRTDALAISARGDLVAASREKRSTTVWTHDLQQRQDKGADTDAEKMVLSPDATFFATVESARSKGVIEVRAVGSHDVIARLPESERSIGDLALAPGARQLLVTEEDVSEPRTVRTRLLALPALTGIAQLPMVVLASFSADGRYLAGIVEDQAVVWSITDLANGKRMPGHVLAGDKQAYKSRPVFSPDGSHVAVGYGDEPMRIAIWRTSDWTKVKDFASPVSEVVVVAVGPGAHHVGLAIGYGGGHKFHVIDTDGECELAQVLSDSRESEMTFFEDGVRVAIPFKESIDIFRLRSQCGFGIPAAGLNGALALAFTSDEQLAVMTRPADSSGGSASLATLNAATGEVVRSHQLRTAGIARFSQNGRWLVVAQGDAVRVVDVTSGRELGAGAAPASVAAVAIALDGSRVVAGTIDQRLQTWRGPSLQEPVSVALPDPLEAPLVAAGSDRVSAITSENTRSGSRLTLRSWLRPFVSISGEQQIGQDRGGFSASVCGLALDGRLVAINAKGVGVIVRETGSGKDLGRFGETNVTGPCAISADGRYAALVDESSVRIWEIATQSEVARIEHSMAVADAVLSPSGRYVSIVDGAGRVSISPLLPADLLEHACARLPANISDDDWQRYVGQEPRRAACPALGPAE